MQPEQIPSKLFMERSGAGIESDIEVLMAPPERPLTEPEKLEVSEYAHNLMAGSLGELRVESDKTLKEVHETDATQEQHTYYIDYFMDYADNTGGELLTQLGYQGLWTREHIKEFLVQSPNMQAVDNSVRTLIASASLTYAKDTVANHLVADPNGQTDYIFTEWDATTTHYEPQQLVDKFKDLMAYRKFYKEVARQDQPEQTDVSDAKRAVLNLHRGRVNSLIAGLYPNLLDLRDQLPYMLEADAQTLEAQITEMGPAVQRIFASEKEYVADNMLRRLDYLRNGAAVTRSESGELHTDVASVELLEMLEELERTEGVVLEAEFSPEEIAVMDSTVWGAEEVKALIDEVLAGWGQLSESTATWEELENSNGRPADGKFQAVIGPGKKILWVEGPRNLVRVPEKFKRTLTQAGPSGALLVVAHELAHVAQNLSDRKLADVLPLAAIKGRNASATREAGGLFQEAAVRRQLGRTGGVSSSYLRALQTKRAGGNRIEASRAFFENKIKTEGIDRTDEKAVREAADLAADRTNRLFKYGHNSEPLVYAEQRLIVNALNKQAPERAAAFVIASGAFNIKDALTLHRYGLLPESPATYDPANDVMKIYKEKISPMIYNAGK